MSTQQQNSASAQTTLTAAKPKPIRARAAALDARAKEAEASRIAAVKVAHKEILQGDASKVPINMRLKQVTDAITKAPKRTLDYQSIHDETSQDVRNDEELRAAIKRAGFIVLDDAKQTARYEDKSTARSAHDVLRMTRERFPAALPLDEVAKAYEGVLDDVESLVRDGHIYRVEGKAYGDMLLFATDANARKALGDELLPGTQAMQEAVETWRSIQVPWEPRALATALRANGLTPLSDPTKRQRASDSAPPDVRKARKRAKKQSAHNMHL